MLLENKTALITGSATGIGEGVAHLFAAEGAKLILIDRDEAGNNAVAAATGGQAFTCDVRDRTRLRDICSAVGAVDILINNAGIYPRRPFLEMAEQEWDEMQDTNLKSIFHLTQAVLPGMIQRQAGKIVNISSVTFHLGTANLTHYVASKGGIIGLTRSLAREIGDFNVHVNCVTPGAVLVEAEKLVQTEEALRVFVSQQCLKRRLVPLDIARVCLFLSSELSDGLTGQTINVDAGRAMY